MRNFLKTLLVCLVICTIFSCAPKQPSSKQQIKIAFWGSFEEVEAIRKIAEKIEKELPGVKLKLEHIAIGNDPSIFSQKILTESAAGTPPDIAFCEVNLFVDFYDKQLFVPLNDFISKDKTFNIKNYFPTIVDRFTVNDIIYIIPRDVAPFAVVYYNKDLFNMEGLAFPTDEWNLNDLLNLSKKLTKKDAKGQITQYGFYTWAWPNFVYAYGGALVDNVKNPKKCLFNAPKTIQGLQFYLDMMYKYKVMPTPSTLQAGYQELFKTGKLAMYCSGVWETPQLRKGASFDWDVVMFPKGPNNTRGFNSGGSGYGILKWCKNKEIAWEILKRLASSDAQEDLAKIGLAQPAEKRLAASKAWALSKDKPLNKKMLNKAVEYVKFDPFTSKWNYINKSIISIKMDPVFLNQAKLLPTLNEVTKDINNYLNKK
ncbi:MAG: sugar ABC transporter substrate-binding protein [bacterium]|nr:sugar ABC transporter substrate-binding protein [bacterium]